MRGGAKRRNFKYDIVLQAKQAIGPTTDTSLPSPVMFLEYHEREEDLTGEELRVRSE